jgi:hypothetical protein
LEPEKLLERPVARANALRMIAQPPRRSPGEAVATVRQIELAATIVGIPLFPDVPQRSNYLGKKPS